MAPETSSDTSQLRICWRTRARSGPSFRGALPGNWAARSPPRGPTLLRRCDARQVETISRRQANQAEHRRQSPVSLAVSLDQCTGIKEIGGHLSGFLDNGFERVCLGNFEMVRKTLLRRAVAAVSR